MSAYMLYTHIVPIQSPECWPHGQNVNGLYNYHSTHSSHFPNLCKPVVMTRSSLHSGGTIQELGNFNELWLNCGLVFSDWQFLWWRNPKSLDTTDEHQHYPVTKPQEEQVCVHACVWASEWACACVRARVCVCVYTWWTPTYYCAGCHKGVE